MNDIKKAIKFFTLVTENPELEDKDIEVYEIAVMALKEKQERDNMRCKNCLNWYNFLDINYECPCARKPSPNHFCSYFEAKNKQK